MYFIVCVPETCQRLLRYKIETLAAGETPTGFHGKTAIARDPPFFKITADLSSCKNAAYTFLQSGKRSIEGKEKNALSFPKFLKPQRNF